MGKKAMATIGLSNLHYALITEAEENSSGIKIGDETYATPIPMGAAITAKVTFNSSVAVLDADNGAAETANIIDSGTIELNVTGLSAQCYVDLFGADIDDNGVIVTSSEDEPSLVSILGESLKSNGESRYYVLYRCQFNHPDIDLQTAPSSGAPTFKTPTVKGTAFRRNKVNAKGKHPIKNQVDSDMEGVSASVIDDWYDEVYEPVFSGGTNG